MKVSHYRYNKNVCCNSFTSISLKSSLHRDKSLHSIALTLYRPNKSNVAIEKILGPESFPSVGRRLIKFQSLEQRNSWSSQICPVRNVPSVLVGTHFLARHVPSVGRLRENECPVSRHRSQRSDFYVPSGDREHYDRIYVPSGDEKRSLCLTAQIGRKEDVI